MTVLEATARHASAGPPARPRYDWRRALPTLVAGALSAVYVIASPPSLDLAAHLFRARLFSAEGFGLWDNWWYAGHHTPGYSVLFPPLAAATSPQLVAAISATGSTVLFESLVHRHFGQKAWFGALWLGVATATSLYTGRLTFALGVLFGAGAALALQRRRPVAATTLALLSALGSPVAALFVALAGAAHAFGRFAETRRLPAALPGVATSAAALLPVLALALAFPEGGTEPFIFMTLWPIPLICAGALYACPRQRTIQAGAVLYALACLLAYAIPSPVGSNAARLAPFVAWPLATLALWPARKRLLLITAIPLLYIQLQAPLRDLTTSAGNPSTTAAYWRPLLGFLDSQSQAGGPFRVEIPFTAFHWEAYEVAPHFALARGWERQLDIGDDGLFYRGRLTAGRYQSWLHQLAVRFVAVSDVGVDASAVQEERLIDRGLPYLQLIKRTAHWRIYAVRNAAPLAQGAATATALGPSSVTLQASRPGRAYVRVRYTPYWALAGGAGCVAPDGDFTQVTLRRPGRVRLVIRFALRRIASRSPRCTGR
jgi:hypothetical protein